MFERISCTLQYYFLFWSAGWNGVLCQGGRKQSINRGPDRWKNPRSSRTEKDRARASAHMQSSQKTVAQRLPHEEKIPQGNALRSIFLRVKSFVLRVSPKGSARNTLTADARLGKDFAASRRSPWVAPGRKKQWGSWLTFWGVLNQYNSLSQE